MDIQKELDKLEDSYKMEEWEDKKEEIIAALFELHMKAATEEEVLNRFTVLSAERFGGIYIPYLFWVKLSDFLEYELDRSYLYNLLTAFSNSDFGEDEQRLLKPLVIVYFSREKEFEINKFFTLAMDDVHPNVKEYFQKLYKFRERNARSTKMYCDKFELLRELQPDFSLMNTPLSELKEKVG
ncbi:MAG: hypothetical protein AAF694_20950 [Bacteroidota bacterium]